MLIRLLKRDFGVALWVKDKHLYVRVRYKNKEIRSSYDKDYNLDKAMLETAIKLANSFPDLVNIDSLK